MRCPFCKIDSMRPAGSGKVPIDLCSSCGAAWFDPGEIRELTEGRFPEAGDPRPGEGAAAKEKEAVSARMARAWDKARSLSCPRCSGELSVVDFQNTKIPMFVCRRCGGLLAPRDILGELSCKFGFHRKNAALYEALGASMATEMRRQLALRYGPDREVPVNVRAPGLPVVVPLADAGEAAGGFPYMTWGLLAMAIVFHVFALIGIGGMDGLASRISLPSGTGFGSVPPFVLWLAPFFHAGILPLAVGCLFLYVLGDNVEGRLGHVPFFLFYLACGLIAGAAHVLWGKAGAPAALGSAGAVAGVLGAYLVFFPQVPISMYKGGEVVSVPAYLFACAWAVAQFLWGWGPLSCLLNPAPYTLAGSLAGFAAGAACAALWLSFEGRTR